MIKSLQTAFENESIVQKIITEQQINGVYFNARKAKKYLKYIEAKKQHLYNSIRPMLKLEVEQPYNVPVNKPFLKTGDYSSTVRKWYGDDIPDISGQFSRVRFREPDIGSRKKLQKQLLDLGWKPRHFTEKGNPKLTVDGGPCESLNEINSQVGQDIALWFTLSHRQSQIQGWLDRLRGDGRLSAEANTIGTPTYRFRHKTVVNVPKAASHVIFGHQMRSLFTVPRGKVMVGHDAAGLELRMLAHYMNDPEYVKIVTEGDPHAHHQKMAGLPTRDDAKTFIYAFNYGAGDSKIGSIIGGDAKAGRRIKTTFLKANPRLRSLIERVTAASTKGYLIGLDGRRIKMRKDKGTGQVQTHKALNTLLQSAGAIVMKHSMVILDRLIKENGLHSLKVIDMHDEAQWECLPEEAEKHAELAVQSIRLAGEALGLRCPLDGEAKIGKNWSQTH